MTYNVPFRQRVLLFGAATVLMAVVASVLVFFITGQQTVPRMRIAIVLQDVLLFVLPPLAAAVIVCRRPAELLLLRPLRSWVPVMLVVAVAAVMIPATNRLVALNEAMRLPSWLEAVEQWMRQAEDATAASTQMMMAGTSVGDLVMNLLIVGLLAGFSEEIFFRGGIQQLLITRPMNAHAAIWITAVIFSAIHLQFYGFIPRLLLGAYFGYLAWWSGSLWLPVVAHMLNNSVVVVLQWLMARGVVAQGTDMIGGSGTSAQAWGMVAASALLTALGLVAMRWACRPRLSRADG